MAKIASINASRYLLPLAEVLVDARHGEYHHFELVTATVRLQDGSEGTGYTYTGGRGGAAILACLRHDLAPWLTGRDAATVEDLHDGMQGHLHYVGRGGIAGFAISAVDIALWDLRGRALGQSLAQLAGGASDRCRAYCGGIDLGFSLPRLLDNVRLPGARLQRRQDQGRPARPGRRRGARASGARADRARGGVDGRRQLRAR